MRFERETEWDEFKASLRELGEGIQSMAAIMNKGGAGTAWFGVRPDGTAVGMDVTEKTLRDVSQAIGNQIRPRIYPSVTSVPLSDGSGREVVRVDFSGDDPPYACRGIYRVRVADEDVQLEPAELRRMLAEQGGGPREEIPEIPQEAVREAVFNAYCHMDWTAWDCVVIDIYYDSVEILSPGWFIEGQDPDEHLSGRSKSPLTRNPLIAGTLYRSKEIEHYGTGIPRIKELRDEAGVRVEYRRTPDGTLLVFHRRDAFYDADEGIQSHGEGIGETVNETKIPSCSELIFLTAGQRSGRAVRIELPRGLDHHTRARWWAATLS